MAAFLLVPASVQAQSSVGIVPAGPAVSITHQQLPELAALVKAGPTARVALERTVTAGAEGGTNRDSAAKESAGLSALAVVMLVLIVAGTAVVGSRKSSR